MLRVIDSHMIIKNHIEKDNTNVIQESITLGVLLLAAGHIN